MMKPPKCPVCNHRAGSGTFLCVSCKPNRWVHPKCGGYTSTMVQNAGRSDDGRKLRCNNCKKVNQVRYFTFIPTGFAHVRRNGGRKHASVFPSSGGGGKKQDLWPVVFQEIKRIPKIRIFL